MRKLLLIGIGAGDPEQVTVQAIKAMNRVDVFVLLDKGNELTDRRRAMVERYVDGDGYRFVTVPDPPRDRTAPAYEAAVEDWTDRRAAAVAGLLAGELDDDGTAAILVWGDPSLYDAALRVADGAADRVEAGGDRPPVAFEVEVIPGISSISALAAAHRTTLTRVGRPVQVTTGRRLAGGWPPEVEDVVVMLDGDGAFAKLPEQAAGAVQIYWGAYLGTEDELLVSGRLDQVSDRIVATRQAARERKGWIMDTYLLRRGK